MKNKLNIIISLLLISHLSYAAETHELRIVKQVYNINAPRVDLMYQFIPDYLEINTGDTVRFLGTVGRHTVHSVRGMYPEGFEKIAIFPHKPNEVTFDIPGVYGIKCKLHQRHGMVSVIVVGGDIHNMKTARSSVKGGVNQLTEAKMHLLLDKAQAVFGAPVITQ